MKTQFITFLSIKTQYIASLHINRTVFSPDKLNIQEKQCDR